MTQGKALQSEAGNLTVLTYGKSGLMIWVDKADAEFADGDTVRYITENPSLSDRAIDIEFSDTLTHEEIKALIDLAFHQRRVSDLAKRVNAT